MSDWTVIRDAVEKAAPLLGSVIGGPAGGVIGTAIAGVLGVSPTPESVGAALASNPAAAQALATYEKAHASEIQSLTAEASAEITATQGATPMVWGRAILLYICGAGFLYSVFGAPLLAGIFNHPFPSAALPSLIAMLTLLLGHGLDGLITKVAS